MRTRTSLLLVSLFLLALAAPASAQSGNASVTVVHGVPNTPVDVYVNGTETLADFQPGTVAGPLSLPAASYTVDIRPAGAAADSAPVISATAQVPAGANVTLVAHLNAEGTPGLTPFVNDVSAVPAGQARLTVRHTAAAPAVDILAGGSAVLSGVTNGQEGSLVVPAGTVSAAVALAGTTEPVIGPADLTLREGTLTAVYAIGSATDGTLDLVVQTFTGLHSAAGVPSGTGGEAASASALPTWAFVAMGAAALVAAGSARRVAALRR